eukprot:jgi/Antlo1/294/976
MPSTSNRRNCKSGCVPASGSVIGNRKKRKKKHGHSTKGSDAICNTYTENEKKQCALSKDIQKDRATMHIHQNVEDADVQESRSSEYIHEMCHKELFDRQFDKTLRMISRHLKRTAVEMPGHITLYADISKIHGIGIFAGQKIPSRTKIIEYVGELIGKKVADKRERFYKENGISSVYLFKIFDDLIVDATLKGNLARFINHSCSPNSIARISHDRIFIYSTREINEGEEITFYYNFSTDEHDDTKLPCYCGHDICTKFMG